MKRFTLWHSLLGTGALLLVEAVLVPMMGGSALLVLFFIAFLGAVVNVYVAVEVVEKVRGATHMIAYFCGVVAEFIIFFALQYHFLVQLQPQAFPALGADPVSLLLHSVMIFVFNPLYLPATDAGRALLLINTLGALGLVLFIFQNITQFRHRGERA